MLKYQKIHAPISKRDVVSKKDKMLWFMQKPNEKLLSFVIILLWEVIYVHFYNWDRPLDLVLVVYDLIDWLLKLHSDLRTIPHLILTHNTQDFDSINAYLICVVVHVQMWCVCSITCWSNPKRFLSVLYFLKVILYFCVFSLCSKCNFVFFFKKWFRCSFVRSSRLKASCKTSLKEINFFQFHTKSLATVSRVFHN